ncbi:RING finger and transmembrane domain-containing protein 2 [Camellia lanceoleosa]|uniref:RING finger and transmembrane domain-containing protein 2 n=1 Tax=Camellia lanceoleosa TaxID=1840588 RepID=A0ACC0HKJ7_9ERIC|nr:RING finger and transmembrane domain-containing protein 2 [Camellia lanceoleosa]
MEASAGNSDAYRDSPMSSSSSRRHGMQFSVLNFLNSPLSTLLEYSGILRTRSSHPESGRLINSGVSVGFQDHVNNDSAVPANGGEVAIRIIGAGEQDHDRSGTVLPSSTLAQMREVTAENQVYVQPMGRTASATSVSSALDGQGDSRSDRGAGESVSQSLNGGGVDGSGANSRDSSYQRYDIQQAARWIEHILPFSLLLLVIFIRQHLQGFFVTTWIAAVMFKSNEFLRKQTALKGERKISVLVGISFVFMLHVIGVYWWYRNDDLLYPLMMLPPKVIPPFWHAIFIILVNDTLVRQVAMVLKCILLMYYKNSRGRNYRKQGQMLTLVEYLLLLYRALLPAPVWYRFFLNKEYGSLFSSLMTGLYLTFKLTSVVEKVQSFFAALKALSRKEIHYGAHATSEQVSAAGDLCAICQEKMHTPISLRCKHIFCEDCVLEWFERERTCPLCRALVKPADLRSFGDGSTSLFFQLF